MATSPSNGKNRETANARALVYLYSRLPFLVQRVDQISNALFAIEGAETRITPLQFQLLDQLHSNGPGSQVDLARLCGIDTSTASLVVGNLIKAKLADRRQDSADKRRNIVELTSGGRSIHAEAAAAYRRVQRRLFLALGDERDLFVDALNEIVRDGMGAPPWRTSLEILPSARGCDAAVSQSLSFLIRRTLQQAEANMAAELGSYDLTTRQYGTLFVISFHDNIGESGIARILGYEATNAALVVRNLAQKDLITSDALHARGRRKYSATNAGKGLLLAVEPALTRGEAALVERLTPHTVAFVQRMLGKIIGELDPIMRWPLVYFSTMSSLPEWPTPLQPHLSVELSIS